MQYGIVSLLQLSVAYAQLDANQLFPILGTGKKPWHQASALVFVQP